MTVSKKLHATRECVLKCKRHIILVLPFPHVAFNVKHSLNIFSDRSTDGELKENRTRGDYCDNGIYYKVAFDE